MKPASLNAARRQRGFVVILMLILVTMGALYALVTSLSPHSQQQAHVVTTGDMLKQGKDALLGYAVTYPDNHNSGGTAYQVFGYLPCPDMDGDGVSDSTDADCGGQDGKAVIGLLPYKELGLSGYLDGEGNCLWYAVSGSFKASSNKPTPMNWDTQGQLDVRDSSGTVLAQPDDSSGGAAAVIFSVGAPLGTQSRPATSDSAPCGITAAAKASAQYAQFIDIDATKTNQKLSEPFPGAANGTVRVVLGSADSSINNDRLLWLTPKEIWDRVRKRADISSSLDNNINTLINDLQGKLTGNLASYTPGTNYVLPSNISYTAGSTLANYYAAFSDHFRLRKCATANDYCFVVNGNACDGILVFGGMSSSTDNATASPRASTKRDNSNYFESTSGGVIGLLTASSPTGASPAVVTGVASSFASSSATADIIQCLTPQPPVTVSTAQMFAASNTAVTSSTPLVATNGSTTLTLGNTTGSTNASLLYGCFWNPTPIPFGTGLRIYFDYITYTRSEGFTFALADADPTRNPTTNGLVSICGDNADALGYAGSNGITPVINYPKMAVEFDFRRSNPGDLGITRNDPALAPTMHFAIDYWGVSSGDANGDDDVTHGAGDGVNDPTNPASGSSGVKQFSSTITDGAKAYVRIDITRAYTSATLTGSYQLNVYIVRSDYPTTVLPGSFPNSSSGSGAITCGPGTTLSRTTMADLTQDLSTACSSLQTTSSTYLRYLTSSITINDVSGAGEALRRVYAGFTTAQRPSSTTTTRTQQIVITNFSAATR